MGASAAMDGESEADMQRAEAWRAEANVRREGLGSHEPARQRAERPARGYGEPEAGAEELSQASGTLAPRYGSCTQRKPMWLVALEISPLPRVPTMYRAQYCSEQR